MKNTRFSFGSGIVSADIAARVDVDTNQRACLTLENFEILNSGGLRPRPGTTELSTLTTLPHQIQALRWSDGTRHLALLYTDTLEIRSLTGQTIAQYPYPNQNTKAHFNQINDLVIICCAKHKPMQLTNKEGKIAFDEWKFTNLPIDDWNNDVTITMASQRYGFGFNTKIDDIIYQDDQTKTWHPADPINFNDCLVPNAIKTAISHDSYVWKLNGSNVTNTSPEIIIPSGYTVDVSILGTGARFGSNGDLVFEYATGATAIWTPFTNPNYPIGRHYCDQTTRIRIKFITYRSDSWDGSPPTIRYTQGDCSTAPITSVKSQGTWFTVGETIAMRTLKPKERTGTTTYQATREYPFTPNSSIPTGQMVHVTRWCYHNSDTFMGAEIFQSQGTWVPSPNLSAEISEHTAYFKKGWTIVQRKIHGTWTITFSAHSTSQATKHIIYGIEEQLENGQWQLLHTFDEYGYVNVGATFTGDCSDRSRYIRVVALAIESGAGWGLCNIDFASDAAINEITRTIESIKIHSYIEFPNNNPDFSQKDQLIEWGKASFSDIAGWPTCSILHEGRLAFSGLPNKPMTLWLSAVDDLSNFKLGDKSSDAIAITLSCDQQSEILWLQSHNGNLIVGTTSGEQIITALGNQPLSATTASAQFVSNAGTHPTSQALMTTDSLMFVDRSGARVRQLNYSTEANNYFAPDLTFLAHDLIEGGIKAATWQIAPRPVAWFVPKTGKNANKLVGFLYNKEQNISAWFTWTTGITHAITCIRSGEKVDELFLITERNGTYRLETIDWTKRTHDLTNQEITATLTTTLLDYPQTHGEKKTKPKLKLLTIGNGTITANYQTMGQDTITVSSQLPKWHTTLAQTYPQEEFYLTLTTKNDIQILSATT